MNDAPVELLAVANDGTGMIYARRAGEPSFTHVQGIGDAYMAARSRGVRITASARLIEQLRRSGDLPGELPEWIDVREGS